MCGVIRLWALRIGEPGPLIDTISIDAGASYVRETALSSSWHTAFRSIVPADREENVDRFCVTESVDDTASFIPALDRCGVGGVGGGGGGGGRGGGANNVTVVTRDQKDTAAEVDDGTKKSVASGSVASLEAEAEYAGCWDGYAAYEDTAMAPAADLAHVWRTKLLRFSPSADDANGAGSLLARCEAVCKGYTHLGLAVRPATSADSFSSYLEADCTCGFNFPRYIKSSVAKAATMGACGGALGSHACRNGPCGGVYERTGVFCFSF